MTSDPREDGIKKITRKEGRRRDRALGMVNLYRCGGFVGLSHWADLRDSALQGELARLSASLGSARFQRAGARILRARTLRSQRRKSPQRQNAVASTLQACAPQNSHYCALTATEGFAP